MTLPGLDLEPNGGNVGYTAAFFIYAPGNKSRRQMAASSQIYFLE